MGEWILIVWSALGLATATFDDKPACEFALEGVKSRLRGADGICVPKAIATGAG